MINDENEKIRENCSLLFNSCALCMCIIDIDHLLPTENPVFLFFVFCWHLAKWNFLQKSNLMNDLVKSINTSHVDVKVIYEL